MDSIAPTAQDDLSPFGPENVLVCTICRGKLVATVKSSEQGVMAEGTLRCDACGQTYPVEDGIANLLPPDSNDRPVDGNQTEVEDEQVSRRYDSDRLAKAYDQANAPGFYVRLRGNRVAGFEVSRIRNILQRIGVVGTVLDIPAGTGKLLETICDLGLKAVAGDASVQMLRQAKHRPGVIHAVMDARHIPSSDRSFSAVVCLRLFQRISPANRAVMLKEFARVSRGWVIASFARNDGLILGLRYRLFSILRGSTEWAPFPASIKEMRSEMAAAGLEVTKVESVVGFLSNEYIITSRVVRESGGPPGTRG